jgi:hypothetical protein
MRDGLGNLGLRQAIVHPDRDMAGQLRDLAVGDESVDRDQAAVARREIGTQPQVAEQDVGRVLHDAGEHCAELIADALGAISLGGLVERQERRRRRGQPIGAMLRSANTSFVTTTAAIAFAQPE